jgi:hypothetical protein
MEAEGLSFWALEPLGSRNEKCFVQFFFYDFFCMFNFFRSHEDCISYSRVPTSRVP